jgi:hypothetical protein
MKVVVPLLSLLVLQIEMTCARQYSILPFASLLSTPLAAKEIEKRVPIFFVAGKPSVSESCITATTSSVLGIRGGGVVGAVFGGVMSLVIILFKNPLLFLCTYEAKKDTFPFTCVWKHLICLLLLLVNIIFLSPLK